MSSRGVDPKSRDIFIVVGGLRVGGTERHLLYVTQRLRLAGWNIEVYSLSGDGPLRAELENAGIKVTLPAADQALQRSRVFNLFRMPLAAVHLTYTMWRQPPALVHFFLPAAYVVGGIAAWITRSPIRVMSRRSLNNYQRGYRGVQWIEKLLHRTMDAILGNSRAVVDQLRNEEGVPEERLGLIYNGIEIPQHSDDRAFVRSSFCADSETLFFIVVANLIPYKGHLDLIHAFSLADKRIGQSWRLLVVGRDDGIGAELEVVARDLGLASQISFLGIRSDVASLMAASDVGLLSSHQEGFSNTILEGMAAGLPMIVTDVGGNAEAVADAKTGLVVPPHNPQLFADAIVRLANDPKLRERYGAAGRHRVEALFAIDACATRYDAFYRGLMTNKAPRDISEVSYQDDRDSGSKI